MTRYCNGHRRRRRDRQRVWALGRSRRPAPIERGDGRVGGRDGDPVELRQEPLKQKGIRVSQSGLVWPSQRPRREGGPAAGAQYA
jgi:hypothetical protein